MRRIQLFLSSWVALLTLHVPHPKTPVSGAFRFQRPDITGFGTLRSHFGGSLDVEGLGRNLRRGGIEAGTWSSVPYPSRGC